MDKIVHTQIFAHRGANKEAAENTRSAFERALAYAVDGIETDIQLSRDEVPVLWHDRFLLKLGHPTKHIDDFDYSELQEMNFADHFSRSAKPEVIVKLDAFLQAYRKRTRLLLEIKNRDWEERERHKIKVKQTLAMVGKMTDDSIMISSFNLDSLIYADQCSQGFPLIYNFEDDQTLKDAQQVLTAHPFLHGLCLPIKSLDEAKVKLLRSSEKRIAVYTCNTDEEINKALALGVDILISDVPQKALLIRDRAS
jgi:glycerophosphoryl diester phosphodiesterase